MNKELTELVFILDRSGSMNGLENDTIGGFNGMLTKQKAEGEKGTDYHPGSDFHPAGCSGWSCGMGTDELSYHFRKAVCQGSGGPGSTKPESESRAGREAE